MSVEARKIRLLMHLRRSGVGDLELLNAIEKVPRESFVPESFLDKAYEDTALPIGLGQTISQPLVVASMTEALEVRKTHRVLEVGTGSGYQTAILALLCRRVYTVERLRDLQIAAEKVLAELRLHNVTTRVGDGFRGWPEQAPFDRIIVTAGAPAAEPPPALVEQLAPGGIMVIPITPDDVGQKVVKIVKTENGLETTELYRAWFVPLVPEPPR